MRPVFVRITVLLASLLLSGCASLPSLTRHRSDLSPERVHQIVRANHAGVQVLWGSGRIAIESPEIAQTGSFVVYVKKPDTIAVKLEGPFGIELGSAIVTPDAFAFYNSFQNQLITGSTSPENLNRVLRVNLDFDNMLNLFTGGSFLEDDHEPPSTIEVDEGYLVMAYRGASYSRRYWIEPGTLLLARIQHLDSSGKLVLEQRFLNYRTVDRYQMPYSLRVTMPRERRVVSISYSEIMVNQAGAPVELSVPRNAERIQFQ